MKEFRLLKADEISCRVNQINDKGLTLLLYKDARVDMDILIWIDAKTANIYKNEKNKWTTKDSFKVTKIGYDKNRNIIGLSIKNQKGIRVYLLTPPKEVKKEVKKDENNKQ